MRKGFKVSNPSYLAVNHFSKSENKAKIKMKPAHVAHQLKSFLIWWVLIESLSRCFLSQVLHITWPHCDLCQPADLEPLVPFMSIHIAFHFLRVFL